MRVKIIHSRYSHIPNNFIGEAKWNRKLKGYEVTFNDVINPVPFTNNPSTPATLFFEKHEVRPSK